MKFADFLNETKGATAAFDKAFKYAKSYVFIRYGLVGGFDGDADEAYDEFGGDELVHLAKVKFEVTTEDGKTGTVTVEAGISQDGDVDVNDDEGAPITGGGKDIEAFITELEKKFGKDELYGYLGELIEDLKPTEEKDA